LGVRSVASETVELSPRAAGNAIEFSYEIDAADFAESYKLVQAFVRRRQSQSGRSQKPKSRNERPSYGPIRRFAVNFTVWILVLLFLVLLVRYTEFDFVSYRVIQVIASYIAFIFFLMGIGRIYSRKYGTKLTEIMWSKLPSFPVDATMHLDGNVLEFARPGIKLAVKLEEILALIESKDQFTVIIPEASLCIPKTDRSTVEVEAVRRLASRDVECIPYESIAPKGSPYALFVLGAIFGGLAWIMMN